MIDKMKHAFAIRVFVSTGRNPGESNEPDQPPIKSDTRLTFESSTSPTTKLSFRQVIEVPDLSDDDVYEMSRAAREQWSRDNPY